MSVAPVLQLPIHQVSQLLVAGEISSVELTQASLDAIEAVNPELNAFISVTPEQALEQARLADQRLQRDENLTPLTGIPMAVKDNIDLIGSPTTCASKLRPGHIANADAEVVQRLKANGAVILGKTNLDQLSMGSWTLSSAYGATRNPWDLDRLPGGSSGGSAAAVAAGLAFAALGSDTGGSIRQPAAHCGIVGLRPTYGRLSTEGLFSYIRELDTPGLLARNVCDASLTFETLLDKPLVYERRPHLTDLRVAWPRAASHYHFERLNEETDTAFEEARDTYGQLGAEITEVDFPDFVGFMEAHGAYAILAAAGITRSLADFYGFTVDFAEALQERMAAKPFTANTRDRVEWGISLLLGEQRILHSATQIRRDSIRREFTKLFAEGYDVIMTPTSTVAARTPDEAMDPAWRHMWDLFTIPPALAGLPAISIPCGFTATGLPIGLQLIARPNQEQKLFEVAYAYEQAAKWHERRPPQISPAS